jgi:hypothetical protein
VAEVLVLEPETMLLGLCFHIVDSGRADYVTDESFETAFQNVAHRKAMRYPAQWWRDLTDDERLQELMLALKMNFSVSGRRATLQAV